MTLEERKTELTILRSEAVIALRNAYKAQSYNAWGKSVSRASIEELRKQIKEYDAELQAVENAILGKGGISVSYGVPE